MQIVSSISAWVHSLIVKNISISSNSVYSNTSNSANSVWYKYKFSLHTVRVSMSKTVPFQTIQFSLRKQFKCKYSLIVKNISILIDSVKSNSSNSNNSVKHKYAVSSI